MQEKCLYNHADFFMVRSPLLPVELYHDVVIKNESDTMKQQLLIFSKSNLFQEAILMSSPSFFKALEWKGKEITEKELSTISSYFTRMTTRSTPFGIFSGIGYGSIDGERLNIEEFNFQKRVKLNVGWLLSYIRKLEEDINILEQSEVKLNSTIQKKGNYYHYYSQFNSQEVLYIKSNDLLESILKKCRNGIQVKDLIYRISTREYSYDELLYFLEDLIRMEFIYTEWISILFNPNPLSILINKLTSFNNASETSKEVLSIQFLLEEYEQSKIGSGTALLIDLITKMNEIVTSYGEDVPIVVNSYINEGELSFTLPSSVVNELKKVAECLWKITPQTEGTPIEEYKLSFLEHYGTNVEVSLLELLDEDLGIGLPNYTLKGNKVENKELTDLLVSKLVNSINNKQLEVEITTKEIEGLTAVNKYVDAPDSIELYCTILSDGTSSFNKGSVDLFLSSDVFSTQIGKSFGRFALENNPITERMKELYQEEDVMNVELSLLSSDTKMLNLLNDVSINPYSISITNNRNNVITLDDLVVGVENDCFYLKSKTHHKRLQVNKFNMVGQSHFHPIFQFLYDIFQPRRSWNGFTWGTLANSVFLPRVKISRTIISPSKWQLRYRAIGKELCFENWRDTFFAYFSKWNIPRLVYLSEGDTKLLLDLSKELHLKVIYQKYRKLEVSEKIILEESFITGNSSTNNGNKYNLQYVVPLIKNESYKKTKFTTENKVNSNHPLSKIYPGNEWISFKIYGPSYLSEEFLYKYVKNFIQSLQNEKIINKFFYINYADPQPHIKLRLFGDKEKLNKNILSKVSEWVGELEENRLIRFIEIDTYNKEIVRYGGEELIELAENFFYFDSVSTIKIKELYDTGTIHLTLDEVAFISTLQMVISTNIPLTIWKKEILQFEFRKNYYSSYRKYKKLINLQNNNLFSTLQEEKNVDLLLNALKIKQTSLQQYIQSLNNIAPLNYYTLKSILHMHLNRMLGIDRELEKEVLSCVSLAVDSLLYFEEKKKKECENAKK
ncbi:lantibiotic dehydratase [Sutcliffiella cohnii]